MPRLACLAPVPAVPEETQSSWADGWEIVRLTPDQLNEDSPFDLVVSITPDLRKTTSHPTFLAGDLPLAALVEDAERFSNLTSYDSWLAAGSIERDLLAHLAAGLDRVLIAPGASRGEGSLLKHFSAWRAARDPWLSGAGDPEIDVIMRVGGRPLDVVTRAVRSLERQTVGRIRLILVRHSSVGLSTIQPGGSIVEIELIDASGGNRGRSLAAGLRAVRSPYFAVLDDDDYLLTDHFAGLSRALARSDQRDRLAYADILRRDDGAGLAGGRMSLLREGAAAGELPSIIERFSSHCWLATSATLKTFRFDHWAMATAEDSLLVAALLRTAVPIHVPSATAVYNQGRDDASAFLEHPQRRADELALYAETAPWRSDIEQRFLPSSINPWTLVGPAVRRLAAVAEGRLATRLLTPETAPPIFDRVTDGSAFFDGAFGDDDFVFVTAPLGGGLAQGVDLAIDLTTGALSLPPMKAWEVAVQLDLSDFSVDGCTTHVAFLLQDVGRDLWCGLLDDIGVTLSRLKTDAAPLLATLVSGPRGCPSSKAFLQAGEKGAAGCTLRLVKVGYRISELQAILSGVGEALERSEGVSRLLACIDLQVVGKPEAAQPEGSVINLASPRHVFRSQRPGTSLSPVIGTGAVAWDYFAQVHLPAEDLASASWVIVNLAATTEPFTAFLVDERFEGRLSEPFQVRADKARAELWIPAPTGTGGAYLIFQAGAAPGDRSLKIVSVAFAG